MGTLAAKAIKKVNHKNLASSLEKSMDISTKKLVVPNFAKQYKMLKNIKIEPNKVYKEIK